MKWHQQSKDALAQIFQVNVKVGLSHKEVKKRLEQVGYNRLEEKKKESRVRLFLRQFQDTMILLLLGATCISFFLGEYIDAITIMVIVLLNGVLGFIQEQKAEKSLESLKKLASPTMKVKREGEWLDIPSEEIVPGDIVRLQGGDKVSADIRLIEANELYAEESALTGESESVAKHAHVLEEDELSIGEVKNMVFKGTLLTKGHAHGIVVSTGMKTEMGKIAHLLSTSEKKESPLEQRLSRLSGIFIVGALFLTTLVVVVGMLQGLPTYEMLLSGVSLAVAAIPEGLPAIVTVVLALGVQRMMKQKAIVRHLPAVETLGSASVICSDKTGTITQNKMTVTTLWNGKVWMEKQNEQSFPLASAKNVLTIGFLCNQAVMDQYRNNSLERKKFHGDPTEVALAEAAIAANIDWKQLLSTTQFIDTIPFDSGRKRMSVIVKQGNDLFLLTKGAPDVLLERATHIEQNGERVRLTLQKKKECEYIVSQMANRALRTIAVAYRPLSSLPTMNKEEVEKDLTIVGIQGMIDPPRPEVKDAIKECRQAGIKTIMITGDHKDTAKAVAKEIGLLPSYGYVFTGKEWNGFSEHEKREKMQKTFVFARVSPEDKLEIVHALQQQGHIVAMTGDGVNDAPALKAANIGIAMGKTGTDVAKDAASLILRDDNFATIRSAIKEGRNIYENIRKFIRYMLASNVGEILVMLFAVALGLPLPLVAIQILWINLITDGLPAMALGLDNPEQNVMRRSPRKREESIFANGIGWKIISRGFLIGVVTLIAFMIALTEQPDNLLRGQTIAFATLVMAQLIHVFDCRSHSSIFDRSPFDNMYLVIAVLSSLFLLLVVIYVPMLQPIFHTTTLPAIDWFLIVGLAAIPTFALAGRQLFKKE